MSEPVAPVPVHQAIVAVMRAVGHLGKQRSDGVSYSFRGVDSVVNALGPEFRNHGVFVLPEVLNYDYQTVKSNANKDMGSVRLTVKYRFIGPAGDEISSTVVAEAFDSGDKATAKAMSVALRTCLLQVMALPTNDPDPDTQQYDRGSEMERDLARWTGEVAACGTDRAKISALWQRMKAEWETVPWSDDRLAIIQVAANKAAQQTEPEPAPEPDTAATDDPEVIWLQDHDQAVEAKDLPTLRKLQTAAAGMRRSDLRKLAAASIQDIQEAGK